MKRIIFSLTFLLSITAIHAQRLHLATFAGISNYQGDLQDKRLTFQQSHFAGGLGLAYELTGQLYFTGGIKFGKLSGDDKKGKNLNRNLSFSSPLTEFQLGLEYDLLNLNERSLTPYIFAGVAAYHFNPSAIDSMGNKAYLQPLSTEGQGFYGGRTQYKLTQISIPFGGGLKLAVSENVRVGIEVGLRKLFTDYIDDVSKTYAGEALLLANRGQQAVNLAFRGGELKTGLPYPAEGSVRGNPKNDWYYFTGLTVSFRLGANSGSNGYGGKYKSGCPRNVY